MIGDAWEDETKTRRGMPRDGWRLLMTDTALLIGDAWDTRVAMDRLSLAFADDGFLLTAAFADDGYRVERRRDYRLRA